MTRLLKANLLAVAARANKLDSFTRLLDEHAEYNTPNTRGKGIPRGDKNALFTHQTLLDEHAEDDGVADLAEALEDLGAQVRVLNHVVQLCVVVPQHPCNTEQSSCFSFSSELSCKC